MIYVSVDEPHPRFAWVRIYDNNNRPTLEELTKRNIEVLRQGKLGIDRIIGNMALGRDTEPHLIMLTPPEAAQCRPCCKDTHEYNRCLSNIDEELTDTLCASIIACGVHRKDHIKGRLHAIYLSPVDFPHIVDYLRFSYSEVNQGFRDIYLKKTGTKAVRPNCKGDQEFLGREHIEATQAPASALLKVSEISSPITDRPSLPLLVFKDQPAPLWPERNLKERMHNCCSGWLDPFNCDPDIGPWVIVRKNGKPLHGNQHYLISVPSHLPASRCWQRLEGDYALSPLQKLRIQKFTEKNFKD